MSRTYTLADVERAANRLAAEAEGAAEEAERVDEHNDKYFERGRAEGARELVRRLSAQAESPRGQVLEVTPEQMREANALMDCSVQNNQRPRQPTPTPQAPALAQPEAEVVLEEPGRVRVVGPLHEGRVADAHTTLTAALENPRG